MAELLLEILCEEIPARMQARAAEDLRLMLSEALASAGLAQGEARSFATPRRLALVIEGLAERSVDVEEERKGPRVGAPDAAIQGFLKGAGLASLAEAEVVKDAKKGDFYVARLRKPGRPAGAILGEAVPDVLARFPWPKSMRWAASRLRWVRPLHGLVCQLDGEVVPVEVEGIAAGAATRGHRFLSSGAIEVRGFADYAAKLEAAKVVLSAEERAELIGREARRIADEHGLELVEDEGLLRENAGLVEWPGVLLGRFEDSFLSVPEEVLMTSMRTHQKCFSLRDPKDGRLVNAFLMVTNMKARDGGSTIVAGNEKVIRARLSDAKFFWEQDLKRPLDEMWSALHAITFHEKLGSQFERVERIAALAEEIAPLVEADKADVRRAAQLCKADLVSGVVGEFPELQGLMGRYYAEAAGTKHAIADAIEEHYQPKGAGDEVPVKPVSVAVALADKLDTLVGFWAIDEKPTGSKDPFALRRAALGVVRTVLDNELRVPLAKLIAGAEQALQPQMRPAAGASKAADLLAFLAERLKVHLREEGARHDLIDAVLAAGAPDDLLMIVRRVEALSAFLATEDGASLLAGVKRAANILRIEEKKDKRSYAGAVEPARLEAPEEKALAEAISQAVGAAGAAVDREDFAGAMAAMAALRGPVDAFFEKVTVNVEDKALRENRLNLLARIRSATQQVADLSKVQ